MTPAPLRGWPLLWRLLVISAMWGSGFPLVRLAAQSMPPLALTVTRGVIGGIALLLIGLAIGAFRGARWGAAGRHALLLGTTNGWVPNVLTTFALLTLGAATAALIQSTAPLLVAVLAGLLLPEERPGPRTLAGLALGFAGVALIIGPGALTGAGGGGHLLASLMMVGAALSYALGTVYLRRARPGMPMAISTLQQFVSAGGALLLALAFEPASGFVQPAPVWGLLLLLGAVGSAIPLALFQALIHRARATDAAMVGYLQPVAAALISAVLLDEVPEPRVMLGGAVVLAGVWLASTGTAPRNAG